jgi:hypothetical protein
MGCTCSQTCLSGRSICVACLHRVRDLLYVVTNVLDRRPLNRSDTTAEPAAVSRVSELNDRSSSPPPNTQGALNTFDVTPPRDAPPGARLPSLEVTVDEQALWINTGMGGRHRFLPVSQVEFFDHDSPSARLRFTLDHKGAVTGLTLSGVGPRPIQATKEISR